jgi:hypothetical protein
MDGGWRLALAVSQFATLYNVGNSSLMFTGSFMQRSVDILVRML